MYNKFVFNLPKGWKIFKNDFYQIDLSDDAIPEKDKFIWIYYNEDILLIEKNDFHLDLGWYGEENGEYCIHFFKGNWLNGELLEKYSSRESKKIAARIQEILVAFENGDFEKINSYKVNNEDFKNQSDFGDLESFEPRKESNS